MRLDGQEESRNVEDARSGGGVKRLGIGATLIILIVSAIFKINPRNLLGIASTVTESTQQTGTPANDPSSVFVKKVLGHLEKTWNREWKSQYGRTYEEPKLMLFRGEVRSACGLQSSAVGPFYCPGDQKVYLDLSFFDELSRKFKAPGDFAQAYVIAHEVGHHLQTLTGSWESLRRSKGRISEVEDNELSKRQELQADCYAGVWASFAGKDGVLETGDVEEGLRAATAIGDDTLQKKARGYAVPESFTHGSAQQRVRWLQKGMQSASIRSCETATANPL